MTRFNSSTTGSKTTNLAGGQAYKETAELELVSLLLTSFANDQFYRSANDTFKQLKELIKQCDPMFVAQAAVYARTQFGMRSITHVTAAELAQQVSGQSWAKDFYNAIVHRPDDMTEIVSYYMANCAKKGDGKRKKKGITKAMKMGFANAFTKFNDYKIAKYRGEGKTVKLVDVANMVHPKHSETIEGLVKGTLKSTDTWETMLTKAGQEANGEEEKVGLKKEAWIELVREQKIPYFALLRNLRNIYQQAPEVLEEALGMLVDEKQIRKSLVLPFRFTTAYEEIEKLTSDKQTRSIIQALNTALELSLFNIPRFEGNTLVVLDVSGSMKGRPSQIGSLFASVLIKANNADLVTFDTCARYVSYDLQSPVSQISKSIRFSGGGTDFHSIFMVLKSKYDRIIILSDMQGWVGYNTPTGDLAEYKNRTGANPIIYSFDLNSYGTLQFPEQNVYCLAGFSEKVFDIMKLLEEDRHALINTIKKVTF
jgi:hypothetical protein